MKEKLSKKFSKTGIFKKKTSDLISRRRKHKSQQLSILADFLANRLSAAGVAHVVKAPSRLRRGFWFVIILLTAAGMSYMTYRVLQEYLAYPTIMRSKGIVMKELEFPAVTVCSLNLIPKIFAKEAGLEYIQEMERILNSLHVYNISIEEKTRCLKDPLCFWSWFEEKCYCHSNPCNTLYCYPDLNKSDEICACSMLLCQWNGTSEGCLIAHDETRGVVCLCRTSFRYALVNLPPHWNRCVNGMNESCRMEPDEYPPEVKEVIDSLNLSSEIAELLKKLRLSMTDDVRDVERFYLPSIKVVDNYGMPYDSLILSCSYGPEPCRDIVTLYSPIYGKCYMFNYIGIYNSKDTSVKMAKQAGRMHGLQLYLQARKQDSLPLLTRELGVRIVVHDPRSIPITAENGIDIRPGDMASVSIEYSEVHRLGPPWGKCIQDGEVLPNNYSAIPYSQSDCERYCVQMEIFRRCHCYHPRFLAASVVPRREIICPNNSTEEDRCFLSVVHDNDDGKLECTCSPPCREKDYVVTTSASQLNPEFFSLVKKAKTLATHDGKAIVSNSDYEFSLMGVQIFYNSFFVSHINETAIYSWESLVANVGGNMGLFLGLSLVTVLEILEFFTEIITKLIRNTRSDGSKRKTPVQTF